MIEEQEQVDESGIASEAEEGTPLVPSQDEDSSARVRALLASAMDALQQREWELDAQIATQSAEVDQASATLETARKAADDAVKAVVTAEAPPQL